MTVASLVQAESNRDADRGKVARVIYNRLEGDATDQLLQIDAAVNYAIDRDLGVALTTEDLQVDSPYNTYKNPGLPPTPIEAPGDAAIAAAAEPDRGAVGLLRDGEPAHQRDEVHRELRHVLEVQGRVQGVLPYPVRRLLTRP